MSTNVSGEARGALLHPELAHLLGVHHRQRAHVYHRRNRRCTAIPFVKGTLPTHPNSYTLPYSLPYFA